MLNTGLGASEARAEKDIFQKRKTYMVVNWLV